jgi:hypothetical protein
VTTEQEEEKQAGDREEEGIGNAKIEHARGVSELLCI